jgi:muramidase (phage lysozyme)
LRDRDFLILGTAIGAMLLFMVKGSAVRSSAAPSDANMQAFLAMVRFSEGTARYPDPWGTYYGGAQFTDKSDHPVNTGEMSPITTPWGTTTAAGAYQIILTTWEDLGGKDYYGDFSNASQDQAAMDLIERRGATQEVVAGNFANAVELVAKEWASLPGSPYGQPTHTLDALAAAYLAVGGTIA